MSNAHTFRAVARLEESMIRASMPKTSAADPVLVPAVRRAAATWTVRNGRAIRVAVAPSLTFALAEVSRG